MNAASSGGHALDGLQAIVTGGGIGGASVALVLAGAGARVTLLERVRQPKAVGAGILLQPNGQAVLQGLGLGPALARQGFPFRTIRVADAGGQPLLESTLPHFGEGLDQVMCIRRSHLMGALIEAVQAHPGIEARFGTEAMGVTPQGDLTYREVPAEGAAGEDAGEDEGHRLRADLLVAADGVHSRLRSGGHFGAEVKRTGVSYVRGVSPAAADALHLGEAWTPLGLFGMGPVDGGTYFYTSAHAPEVMAALGAQDLVAFKGAWNDAYPAGGAVLEGIERFDQLLVNEVLRVDCERFADGRLVLLGDAAHAMAPNLGQGANSALVDAAVLTHELCGADAGRGAAGAVAIALNRYDRRRRPAVRAVQDAAGRLGQLAERRHPLVRRLRDTTLRALGPIIGDGSGQLRRMQQEDPVWLRETVSALGRPTTHDLHYNT